MHELTKKFLFLKKTRGISNEERILLDSADGDKAYNVSLTLRAGDNKKAVLKVIDSETGDILDSKSYEISLAISSDFDF